jgi:hypothetical protein
LILKHIGNTKFISEELDKSKPQQSEHNTTVIKKQRSLKLAADRFRG